MDAAWRQKGQEDMQQCYTHQYAQMLSFLECKLSVKSHFLFLFFLILAGLLCRADLKLDMSALDRAVFFFWPCFLPPNPNFLSWRIIYGRFMFMFLEELTLYCCFLDLTPSVLFLSLFSPVLSCIPSLEALTANSSSSLTASLFFPCRSCAFSLLPAIIIITRVYYVTFCSRALPFLNAFIELFLSSRLFCRMSCCTCKTA